MATTEQSKFKTALKGHQRITVVLSSDDRLQLLPGAGEKTWTRAGTLAAEGGMILGVYADAPEAWDYVTEDRVAALRERQLAQVAAQTAARDAEIGTLARALAERDEHQSNRPTLRRPAAATSTTTEEQPQ